MPLFDVPQVAWGRVPHPVRAADFRYVKGEHLVTAYESSPGTHRTFCGRCGSRLITSFAAHPEYHGLPLGGLDDDPGVKPTSHVYVADKAPWCEITDGLPRYALHGADASTSQDDNMHKERQGRDGEDACALARSSTAEYD